MPTRMTNPMSNPQSASVLALSDKLAQICDAAWQGSPLAYRQLEDAGFGPDHWPDWDAITRIPVLTKADLARQQAHADGPLSQLSRSKPQCLFLSPGDYIEPDMPAAEQRLSAYFANQGIGPSDVVLNGFNYNLTPAGLLFHTALIKTGATVLPVGPQNLEAATTLAVRARATGFVGITGHLKLLLERMVGLGHDVPGSVPLRIGIAGGEPLGGSTREELRSRFGVLCHDFYGTADVGVVAGGESGVDGMVFFDGVVAEILDPESGQRLGPDQPGHLVLSVSNPNYPLLRLGTGDLTTLRAPLADGRQVMGPVLGRIDGAVRARGMMVHPGQVTAAIGAVSAIRRGRVEVERIQGRDRITAVLDVVGDTEQAAQAFLASFRLYCRLGIDSVTFDSVPESVSVIEVKSSGTTQVI